MKKLLVAGALLAAVGSASADDWFDGMKDCKPVIGIDLKWAHVKNSGSWSGIFPESFPAADIYVGSRLFTENFGVELGYGSTDKRTKDTSLVANNTVGGATVPSADGIGASVRFAGPYLDLVGYWPLENCFEAFVSVGLGRVKPTVRVVDLAGPANTNFDRDITSITGKGKTIARVGVGVNWMATEMVGLRVKALYENTSKLAVQSNAAAANQVLTNLKPWKNSYSLAVGAFLKF